MQIKTVIVEDNYEAINIFKQICLDFFPQIEIVAEYTNVKEAISYISKNQFDWLVLDIELEGDLNGFDLINLMDTERKFKILFYSGKLNMHLEALRANAFDFLSKPFSISELNNAIQRYLKLNKNELNNQIEKSQFNLQNAEQESEDVLKVNTHSNTVFIKKQDIVFLFAKGAYTNIHYAEKQKIKISKNLLHMMGLLKNDFFVRISRSIIVNKSHIDKIQKKNNLNSLIIFKDGSELQVSNVIRRNMYDKLNNK